MTTPTPATYVCVTGFDYEGSRKSVRVEPGQKVPKLPASTIAELLAYGDIVEAAAGE